MLIYSHHCASAIFSIVDGAHTGSRRVWVPAMSELQGLGLFDVERLPKKYICAMSDRWRGITSKREALLASVRARRVQRRPPMTMPPQPATASTILINVAGRG
jgi:hypothetical protein